MVQLSVSQSLYFPARREDFQAARTILEFLAAGDTVEDVLWCTIVYTISRKNVRAAGDRVAMKFVSIRDFRTHTAAVRKDLAAQQEFVLTAKGRPIAIVAQVDENNFEQRLGAVRRGRARELLGRIQAKAQARGTDRLSMKRIDAIIAESRRDRRRGR